MQKTLSLVLCVTGLSLFSGSSSYSQTDASAVSRPSCITGTTMRGSGRPASLAEPRPFPGATIAIRRNEQEKEFVKVRTDGRGRFKVNVPPGRYIVQGLSTSTPSTSALKSESVVTVVNPNSCTDVKLLYDTEGH